MVLNDVFDVAIDSEERPDRPIPAGQIPLGVARLFGFGLLVLGLLACLAASQSIGEIPGLSLWEQPSMRCVTIGALLCGAILLYDGPLKRTPLAPILMGCCRALNVLLGASTFSTDLFEPHVYAGLPTHVWWVAGAILILITGVTLLGRNEAKESQSHVKLVSAGSLIFAGYAALVGVIYCPSFDQASQATTNSYLAFLVIISLVAFRRVIDSIRLASPNAIQTGVIAVLRSLIFIDAGLCYYFSQGNYIYASVAVAMMIPSYLLGRSLRST